jgi:hypothetical protein
MHARENVFMEKVVERGVLIDHIKGPASAWAFMVAFEVPETVISRVLSAPNLRRPADNDTIYRWQSVTAEAETFLNDVRSGKLK